MRSFSRIRRDSENHKNAYNREGESSRFSRGCIRLGDNLSRLAASALLHGLAEKVFDLTVDAAQLVLRPGFELGPERRIDAQKKGLSFHHPCQSVIQRAGVDYGAHFGFAAKDNHEIADHGGFALVVENDNVLFGEFLERHVHHADGALNNFLARGDDGFGLLPAEHGLGNFRPAVLDHYTLWNVEELFWRAK